MSSAFLASSALAAPAAPAAPAALIVPTANEWTWEEYGPLLLQETGHTLQMVLATMVIGGILGLFLGLLLYSTRPGGLYQNRTVYSIFSVLVNFIRPIPFIIFIMTVRPLTTLVVGTTFGVPAAVFAMSIMCTMATGRMVEQNLVATDPGIVEAGRAMGASRIHVLLRIVVPEALAPLILAYAFLFIGVVDMSAMAGTIGAGGLGYFALSYGYTRYNDYVTWAAVLTIIVIVQLVQALANFLANRVLRR